MKNKAICRETARLEKDSKYWEDSDCSSTSLHVLQHEFTVFEI